MARYFTQGTFNVETNRADSVRKAMVSGFTDAIANGKTTWTIEDDAYANSNAERTVFENSNGFAIMVVNHLTSSTDHNLNTYIGKNYDVSTHTLNNLGISRDDNRSVGADGYSTETYNPTSTQTITTPTLHQSYNVVTIPSTYSNWFIVVDDDYAVFAIKDGSTNIGTVWYFGAVDSSVTNTGLTDSAPFILTQNFSNGSTSQYNPVIILHSLNNGSKTIVHSGEMATEGNTNETGRPATATMYDVYKSGTKSVMTKVAIYRQNVSLTSVTNPNTDGHKRGTLKGVLYGSPTGAAWGDEIDVDGVTYLYGGGLLTVHNAMAWWVAID